jgi:predicted transporter
VVVNAVIRLFDPSLATRRWLKLGLTVGGALAGAAFGIALTRLGKIVADAPPATLGNYAWNAAVFGVIAGIVSPIVSWTALRRAPLWRTVVEPLAYALAGGCIAVVLGVPALLLLLPPVGLALGFVGLQRRYPDPHVLPSAGRLTNADADRDDHSRDGG